MCFSWILLLAAYNIDSDDVDGRVFQSANPFVTTEVDSLLLLLLHTHAPSIDVDISCSQRN